MDSRGGYVSKILYVKTKESGPLVGGGRALGTPLDPPMDVALMKIGHESLVNSKALKTSVQCSTGYQDTFYEFSEIAYEGAVR